MQQFYAANLEQPVGSGVRSMQNLGGYMRQNEDSSEIRRLGQQMQQRADQLQVAFQTLSQSATLPEGTGQLIAQTLSDAQAIAENERGFFDNPTVGAARAAVNYLSNTQRQLAAMQSQIVEPLVARHSAGDDSNR